jgi:predicted acylesterase/phospholipase RssA
MSDDLAAADYGSPTRTCDIVMKGGITSGVVYPHAICELAKTYRFKQVGGTSAGAIAAAATAAAELGRARGGFEELARLPDWLGGGRHLQELFQPEPRTEGLFRMLIAALEHERAKWLWILLTGLRRFPLAPLLCVLPGLALIVLAITGGDGALLVLAVACGLLLAIAGLLIGLALAVIRRLTTAVPDNLYGICSGNARAAGRPPALTPWLTELIERCAGRMQADGRPPATPLTYGDLEASDGPRLAMMTTNVTNHTAHRLPWAAQDFWFDPDELKRLFPAHVVDHMAAHPPPLPEQPGKARETALYRELLAPLCPFPAPADLPIVVAARMSLSFPLLLSAVPLHRIDWSRTHNQEAETAWRQWLGNGEPAQRPSVRPRAECCWFTDGGASSNFPVHFFDAPLPSRPTFAVNLRPFHPDHPESTDERENVWMVPSARGGQLAWWYPLPSAGGLLDRRLAAFLGGIVRTMQNRVDDAQLRMPGQRDRTVHVSLTKDQGGMNLTMDPTAIDLMTRRGREAGAKLTRRFSEERAEGEPLSWRDHRWTRLRSAMPATGELLSGMAETYAAEPAAPERGYRALLADGHGPPYEMTAGRREQAAMLLEQLTALGQAMKTGEDALANGRPSPAAQVRMVPPD